MKIIKSIVLVLGIHLVDQIGLAEDDFSKEVVKSTQLTTSLHMLEGAGGNITALIGPDGVLLVDDDFAQMADKLLSKLNDLKGTSPKYIVNTHFHYDHTGGNEVFGRTATIIAASAVRERLMKEQTLWGKKHPPASLQALPTLTFERMLTLEMNGEKIRILHLPNGHTDGDTVVLFTHSKVASLGDLYFSGMFPIFHREHDGSLEGYIRNIEIVLNQLPEDCKIVSGHGPLSTKADLEKYRQMIASSVATVKKGITSGRTLEQIQKAGLDSQWRPYSHGYVNTDRWIAMIYAAIKN